MSKAFKELIESCEKIAQRLIDARLSTADLRQSILKIDDPQELKAIVLQFANSTDQAINMAHTVMADAALIFRKLDRAVDGERPIFPEGEPDDD